MQYVALSKAVVVLRLKYDVLKRELKKKINANKVQRFRTGGGNADIKPLTEYEEELSRVLSLSIEGLPSRSDSDGTVEGYKIFATYFFFQFLSMCL